MKFFEKLPDYIYQDITFEELVKAIEEEITKAVQELIEEERK